MASAMRILHAFVERIRFLLFNNSYLLTLSFANINDKAGTHRGALFNTAAINCVFSSERWFALENSLKSCG